LIASQRKSAVDDVIGLSGSRRNPRGTAIGSITTYRNVINIIIIIIIIIIVYLYSSQKQVILKIKIKHTHIYGFETMEP